MTNRSANNLNRGQVDLREGEGVQRRLHIASVVLNRGVRRANPDKGSNVVATVADVEGFANFEVFQVLVHTESVQQGSDRKEGFGGKISKCGQEK